MPAAGADTEGLGFDAEQYTRSSRQAWDGAARIYADQNARQLEPYGLALLARLAPERLAPGAAVLDIASGPGEPALTLARRLAVRGRVVGIDLSPEMLRIARDRAGALGLDNLEFREADAHRLPFEDDSFDLVTCRFGLMLMAEPSAVAREARRVLKPGGRFGLAVWAESARQGPTGILRRVAGELAPADALPPGPDPFALGDARVLEDLLRAAGLVSREIEVVSSDWRFDDARQYLHNMSLGSPCGRLLARFPRELVERIENETLRRVSALAAPDGSLSLPAEALLAVAARQ